MEVEREEAGKHDGKFHCSDDSRRQEKVDVFDLFRPSLWVLRMSGIWLPGELKTTPSVSASLRGGFRAILYLLYCVVIALTLWTHGIRLILYAATVDMLLGEQIMAIIMIFIFASTALLHLRSHVRKPLIEFTEVFNKYYRTYGGYEYVHNMKKKVKTEIIVLNVSGMIFVSAYFLFFLVWFPNHKWINFPMNENATKPIQIIWSIFNSIPWVYGSSMGVSLATINRYLFKLLHHEFSRFNAAVKLLAKDLQNEEGTCCSEESETFKSNPDTNPNHRAGKLSQIATAPKAQVSEESSAVNILHLHANAIDMAENTDDLRYRFERLVDLVDKLNDVLKYEIIEMHLVFIPVLCLVVKGFVEAANTVEYVTFMIVFGIGMSSRVIYYSTQAIRLNVQAHGSSQYLLKPRFKHLSEKTIQLINVFVARLNGPPIGVTVCGLITIDISSTLTLVGTLVAYIFVVVELGAGSSAHSPLNLPALNASTALANWTGSQ